ncbi:hypothetical protein [Marinobacter salarius]|uniref:hypothetical protein n=1 Tax=Marinobacter salarius TaxID=1420917 RepID=UPI003BAA400D
MISINHIVGLIAIFLSLFSWVGFGILDLDSQPWGYLAFLVFVFLCGGRLVVPEIIKLAFIVLMVAIFFAIIKTGEPERLFLLARSIFNYTGFFLIFLGFYNFLLRYGFPKNLIKLSVLLWILGGVVELFYPEFLNFFAPRRTSETRGVTSFAPEPTFFAIYLFFISWLLISYYRYRYESCKFFLLINFFGVIFLAKSAMGVLYIAIALAFVFIYNVCFFKFKKGTVFFSSILAVILVPLGTFFVEKLEATRMVSLVSRIISEQNPLNIFYLDASMNLRLEHIVFSLHGLVHNIFLPGGFDSFGDVRHELVGYYGGFFWYGESSNIIMSWVGDWFYQLGIFGVAIIVLIFYGAYDHSKRSFFELALLFLILLSAVPIALPIVPMLFASLYALKTKKSVKAVLSAGL